MSENILPNKDKAKAKAETALRPRVRLTIHGNERFFGPGICELLEKIDETGSIRAAAAQMEMSYTKAWKILNRAEREMHVSLVTRVNGGKNGGSSDLTEAGRAAVLAFREMEEALTKESEALLERYVEIFRK
jgi:molybdate transport system regulatory protein